MTDNLTVKEVYDFMDTIAPFETQESWDNSGLLVGAPDAPAEKIGAVLEVTEAVLEQAQREGIGLIVTHHPILFKPARTVLAGSLLYEAVRSGISVICCHTPLDKADGGVNDTLAEMLGLRQIQRDESGFLRIGELGGISIRELIGRVQERLNPAAQRYYDSGRPVFHAAVCSGSGCSLMKEAGRLGCDVLITGDADHHDFLDAREMGLSLIAAGHYETERVIVPILRQRLEQAFPGIPVVELEENNPISVIKGENHGT